MEQVGCIGWPRRTAERVGVDPAAKVAMPRELESTGHALPS
jgi:hypothetical protein